jgi:AGZA family xanthine/uracil permease-like MFS transporter
MLVQAAGEDRPPLWTTGDWNALFGYGSNLLVNVLTLTGMLRFVVGMPADFIFARVLPAVGVMLFLSSLYYSWLAFDLARRTGRRDVCALPSGPGVGHIFIVTLVVMLPIKMLTGDYVKAWEAGMAWVFIQSIVITFGGFAGAWIRRIAPRAALLSALAGIALTYIAVRPLSELYFTPVIGLLCLTVILLDWLGGYRLFGKTPAGLVVLALGALLAWGSNLVGLNFGGLTVEGVGQSLTQFGFRLPIPAFGHVFSGFEFIGILLITAIPFGIYDIVEAIDNVESAAGAGDDYPTNRVLVADGVVSMIGALLGNPFMLVVYVGHPAWKAMGGRVGYCAASGLMILALCLFGIVPLVLAIVPVVAVYPILVFIAMIIGSQAFRETPSNHAPAVILGILPHLAHWAGELVKNTLKATGAGEMTPQLAAALAQQGILIEALEILGNGAVLTGIIISATAVFIIERKPAMAAAFCAAGAVFTFAGLMHSREFGIGQSPTLALTYLLLAGVILFAGRTKPVPVAEEPGAGHVAAVAAE